MTSCIYAPIREAVYSLQPGQAIQKSVDYAFYNEKISESSQEALIKNQCSWKGGDRSWVSGAYGENSIIYHPAYHFFYFLPIFYGDTGFSKGCAIFILVLLAIQIALIVLFIFIGLLSSLVKFGKEIYSLNSLKKRLNRNLNTNRTIENGLIHGERLEKLTKKALKIVKFQKSLAVANLVTTLLLSTGIIVLIGVITALLITTTFSGPGLVHTICLGLGGGSIGLGLVVVNISCIVHNLRKPRFVRKASSIVSSLTQFRRSMENSKVNDDFQYCCRRHKNLIES